MWRREEREGRREGGEGVEGRGGRGEERGREERLDHMRLDIKVTTIPAHTHYCTGVDLDCLII